MISPIYWHNIRSWFLFLFEDNWYGLLCVFPKNFAITLFAQRMPSSIDLGNPLFRLVLGQRTIVMWLLLNKTKLTFKHLAVPFTINYNSHTQVTIQKENHWAGWYAYNFYIVSSEIQNYISLPFKLMAQDVISIPWFERWIFRIKEDFFIRCQT